ncbi:MAG: hypothetical protein U1D97_00905 [Desulfuromonadales bacterium]|nr:hypothetical protein [Desulfuromonadales bacterium]
MPQTGHFSERDGGFGACSPLEKADVDKTKEKKTTAKKICFTGQNSFAGSAARLASNQ